MARDKKILLSAIFLAVVGWVTAVVLLISIGSFKLRAVSAENEGATWKRQAGKAYNEMLKARTGTNNTAVLIPKGTRIDCKMNIVTENNKTFGDCVDGTFYPPRDY